MLLQRRPDRLLEIIWLPLLDDQHILFAAAEVDDFGWHKWIGYVEHIDRNFGRAVSVGKAQALQRTHHAVVEATLHNDANMIVLASENLVEMVFGDVLDGRGPA